jgi:hypothetical protein
MKALLGAANPLGSTATAGLKSQGFALQYGIKGAPDRSGRSGACTVVLSLFKKFLRARMTAPWPKPLVDSAVATVRYRCITVSAFLIPNGSNLCQAALSHRQSH